MFSDVIESCRSSASVLVLIITYNWIDYNFLLNNDFSNVCKTILIFCEIKSCITKMGKYDSWGRNGRDGGSWNVTDTGTPQPQGGFTPNQVHWNCHGLGMCKVIVICPRGHNGRAHGRDKHAKGSWNLAGGGGASLTILSSSDVFSSRWISNIS